MLEGCEQNMLRAIGRLIITYAEYLGLARKHASSWFPARGRGVYVLDPTVVLSVLLIHILMVLGSMGGRSWILFSF